MPASSTDIFDTVGVHRTLEGTKNKNACNVASVVFLALPVLTLSLAAPLPRRMNQKVYPVWRGVPSPPVMLA